MFMMVVKVALLFVSILIIMPLVFFFLVSYFGKWFSVSSTKSTLLSRLQNPR